MDNSSAITWGRYWCINGSFGIVLNTDWICALSATVDGHGMITTYQPNGKELVKLSATADDTGGIVSVFNKTGEDVVQLVVC